MGGGQAPRVRPVPGIDRPSLPTPVQHPPFVAYREPRLEALARARRKKATSSYPPPQCPGPLILASLDRAIGPAIANRAAIADPSRARTTRASAAAGGTGGIVEALGRMDTDGFCVRANTLASRVWIPRGFSASINRWLPSIH